MTEFRPQMRGLVTDPSRILAGQAGFVALDNAMCKRDGLVEPRGGLSLRQFPPPEAAVMPDTVYARETWYVATDGTNSKAFKQGESSSYLTVAGDQQGLRAEPFADRQCWTFSSALRMQDTLAASSTTFARLPGAPRAPGFYCQATTPGAATTLLLAPHQGVAYRIVIVRHITTAQGSLPLFGAPSDRVVFWNLEPFFVDRCNVLITVPIGALAVNDEIQLYRTEIVTTEGVNDPGDEMQMLTSYRISATPASADTWTYVDSAEDGTWSGPSLYTNDTQEGIAQSNYRIRVARDVAFYNSMAFYAQGTPGQTKTITCRSMLWNGYDDTATPVKGANTLASFPFSGDTVNDGVRTWISNCNPTVTQLVANGWISVGQHVNLAANDPLTAAGSPAYGEIVSWSTGANTITLDSLNVATAAGTAFIAWDWVGVQFFGPLNAKQRIFAYPINYNTFPWSITSGVFFVKNWIVGSTVIRSFGGSDMERAWAFRYVGDQVTGSRVRLYTAASDVYPYGQQAVLRFEWDDNPNTPADSSFSTPFEVISSKAFAFSQEVGTNYSANICRSTQEGGFARLWYSKLQLPESVPLANWVDIGDLSAPIVRIVPTQDSLWVFKADGIWRVYGETPETLIVQQFDTTKRAISEVVGGVELRDTRPWYRRVGNTVYAWLSAGIHAVDSTGARRVDGPIEWQIRALGFAATLTRPFASSSIRDDLVVFGAQATDITSAGFIFCLHVGTGTWSTWSTQLSAVMGVAQAIMGSGDTDTGALLLGSRYGHCVYTDRAALYSATLSPGSIPRAFSDTIAGPDAQTRQTFTVTSVSADGKTITGINSATYDLVEGCVITPNGTDLYMVLSVSGNTATVDRAGILAGSCITQNFPIRQTITYAATTEGTPWVEKFYACSYVTFQNLRGGTRYRTRYRAQGQTTPSAWLTEQYPTANGTATTLPNAIGINTDREFEGSRDVPKDQTRTTGLEVTVELNQACVYSAISAFTLTSEDRSDRTGGRS